MSNFTDFGGGGIKSVQRGVSTPTSGAEMLVTVSAVDTTRSSLSLLSTISNGGLSITSLRLVNSTQVGVTSYVSGSVGQPLSWELREYT